MPKAILLDMDDTIISFDHGVDTDACWRKAFNNHLTSHYEVDFQELLIRLKEIAKWYWSDPDRHRIGRMDLFKARQEIVSAALMKCNITDDQDISVHIALTYGEERDKAVSLFPGAIETIQQLRDRGIKLALLTNGNAETQWVKIRRFNLTPLFDCVLVEGEFGIGKPDTRIYNYALESLGVKASEAWMIGDNFEWEVTAPQRIGIKGIWIDHKGIGVPASSVQPYMIVKNLSEVITILDLP
jgi:putative hydrolase of the HAD superfamily